MAPLFEEKRPLHVTSYSAEFLSQPPWIRLSGGDHKGDCSVYENWFSIRHTHWNDFPLEHNSAVTRWVIIALHLWRFPPFPHPSPSPFCISFLIVHDSGEQVNGRIWKLLKHNVKVKGKVELNFITSQTMDFGFAAWQSQMMSAVVKRRWCLDPTGVVFFFFFKCKKIEHEPKGESPDRELHKITHQRKPFIRNPSCPPSPQHLTGISAALRHSLLSSLPFHQNIADEVLSSINHSAAPLHSPSINQQVCCTGGGLLVSSPNVPRPLKAFPHKQEPRVFRV